MTNKLSICYVTGVSKNEVKEFGNNSRAGNSVTENGATAELKVK